MKQLKIINASITKQQALELLDQNHLKATYYKVPQCENKELAEAMRLMSGLGYIIQHCSDSSLVGSFLNASSVSDDVNKKEGKAGNSIIHLFVETTHQETDPDLN